MINPEHFKKLEKSLVGKEIALNFGVRSLTKEETTKALGYSCPTGSLAFPYYGIDGKILAYRVAPEKHPDVTAKYLAPKEKELSCFFAPEDITKFSGKAPILITEGEKKLLSLKTWLTADKQRELGFVSEPLCLSIPGCYGWSSSKNSGSLASILAEVSYKDRDVYFLGDTDFFTNPKVHEAYTSFIKEILKKEPNKVSLIDLRLDSTEEKVGVDDFLVSKNDLVKRFKAPFWAVSERLDGPISDDKDLTRVLQQSVLSGKFHTTKVISYIKKHTEMTKKEIQRELISACSQWKKTKPKTESETKFLESQVLWDKMNETTEIVCQKVGSLISKTKNVFKCPTTGHLFHCSYEKNNEMEDGEAVSSFFYDKIFFQKGTYDDLGAFKKDSKGYLKIDSDITNTILNDKKYTNLQELNLYSSSPIYANGTLVYERGYNKEAKVFYAGEEGLKPRKGMVYINTFLNCFPFKTESDRVNALAMLITTVFFRDELLRPALVVQGDQVDLGKSSLAKGISLIAQNGDIPKTVTYTPNEEELEKSIASHVKTDSPCIIIDNIHSKKTITSAVLERSLTDDIVSYRQLGKNDLIQRKNIYQVFLSLNGGVFSPDLSTRSVMVDLCEDRLVDIKSKPAEGIPTARKYKKEITEELLFIMQEWINKKYNSNGFSADFPKFITWAKTLYSVLKATGLQDEFLKNNDEKKLKFDPVSKYLTELAGIELESKEKTEARYSSGWKFLLENLAPFVFPGSELTEHAKTLAVSKALRGLHNKSNLTFVGENGKIDFSIVNLYDTAQKTNQYYFKKITPSKEPITTKVEEKPFGIITTVPDEKWFEPQQAGESYSYEFNGKIYSSSWWNDETLDNTLSFDLETEVDNHKNIILMSVFDGKKVYRILPSQLSKFLELHKNHTLICHNSEFDINHLLAFCDRMTLALPLLKNKQIKDTLALSKLISLAEGQVAGNDLGTVTSKYLGIDLPKDVEITIPGEKKPKKVSLSYGHYPNIKEAPRALLHYNAFDVFAPFFVWSKLKDRAEEIAILHGVDPKKLLSYELLVSTGICGGITSHYGFKIDEESVLKKQSELKTEIEQTLEELRKYGYDPVAKKLEKRTKRFVGIQDVFGGILKKLEEEHDVSFVKNYHNGRKKEVYSSTIDNLKEFSHIPFIKNYLDYERLSDTLVKYVVPLLYKERIHSTFKAGKTSGRISSTNPNLQNVPRIGGLRELYISGKNKKLVIADYSGAELQCAGQYSLDNYGHSHFAEMLNQGVDVHKYVASKYLKKPENELTKSDRAAGKPFNFGRFAGSGPTTLQATAKNTYNVDLTIEETKEIINVWDNLFPEAKDHFNAANKALEKALGVDRSDMYPLLKTAKGEVDKISEKKQAWAWDHIKQISWKFPNLKKYARDISNHIPSEELERALQSTRVSITSRSGRIRGGCNYSTWCNNGALQSPQADITNTAWRRILEEGFKVVNVVHDEFIVECDESKAKETQKRVSEIMLEVAKEFNPDMTNMAVESAITDKWEKV